MGCRKKAWKSGDARIFSKEVNYDAGQMLMSELHQKKELEKELEEKKNWKPSRDKLFVPEGWSNNDNIIC